MLANEARAMTASNQSSQYAQQGKAWLDAIHATIRAEARKGGFSVTIPAHEVQQVTLTSADTLRSNGFTVVVTAGKVRIGWEK